MKLNFKIKIMKADNENWKSCGVIGFPNYEVSDFGNVRSSITKKIKNVNVHTNGYKMVCLYNETSKQVFNVGRLVLMVFNPVDGQNIPKLLDADHISSDKSDNRLINLRWLPHKYNCLAANAKLHLPRGHRHTKGIILVYQNGIKEYYRKWDDCPIPNIQIQKMLKDNHLSKKHNCRAFYAGEIPEQFEYLFNGEYPLF